jgi:DNA-binding NtrC family response regulator
VIAVGLPPLRDRREDIPALAEAILTELNQKHHTRITSLDPAVFQALEHHAWPGNVRELRNILERAVVLAGEGEVRLEHLPQSLTGATAEPARRTLGLIPSVSFNVGATLEQAERELIEITLAYTKNNRTRAAEILGINQKTLYNKLKEYGEDPGE